MSQLRWQLCNKDKLGGRPSGALECKWVPEEEPGQVHASEVRRERVRDQQDGTAH